jgi:hypothetical protein
MNPRHAMPSEGTDRTMAAVVLALLAVLVAVILLALAGV